MSGGFFYRKLTRDLSKSIDPPGSARIPSDRMMKAASITPCKPLDRRRLCAWALFAVLGAFLLSCCPAFLYGGMPRVHKHERRQEIYKLEEAWRNAVLKSNVAVMDSLLADDYTAITPNGMLLSKEQTLANLRIGATRINAIQTTDRKVRFYGKTALLTCRAEVSGTNAGQDMSGSYRYTHVYVQDARGQWKIVSFEASRIHTPGDPK
jgi:ketosteroid isomerase-like protein